MALSTIEGSLVVSGNQIIASFIGVYILALGGSTYQLGLVTSIPFLLNAVAVALVSRVHGSSTQMLRYSVWAAIGHRILIMLVPFAPGFGDWSPWWVIVTYSFASAPMMLSATFWTAAISDMFPADKRGRVFGIRNMFIWLSSLVATYLGGLMLDAWGYPHNFTITFWFAGLLAAVSTFFLGRLKLSDHTNPAETDHATEISSSTQHHFWGFLWKPSGRALLKVAIPTALLNIGFLLCNPVVNVYYVEILSLNNTQIGLLTSVFVLFQVIGSVIWGSAADRIGNWRVLIWSAFGMAMQAAVFWIVPSVPYLVVAQAFGGFCYAGFLLASFNVLIATGKDTDRAQAISWFHVIGNLAGFIAPFIGTAAFTSWGLVPAFLVATMFRSLATIFFMRGVPDVERRRFGMRKTRLAIGRP